MVLSYGSFRIVPKSFSRECAVERKRIAYEKLREDIPEKNPNTKA
jgi:hypothetical protein